MSTIFCSNCGNELRQESVFCPRCGTRIEAAAPIDATKGAIMTQPSQPVAYAQPKNSSGRMVKGVVIGLLIILILIVPVIPRDRVVYVNGVTQAVTMSTAFNTSIQTYTTTAPMQIGVYQGTLQYIPDQYYNQYYNQNYNQNYYNQNYYGVYQYPYYYGSYPYTSISPSCYYNTYDDYYCSYSYYYYPYYGYYNYRYRYGYNNYAPYYSSYNKYNSIYATTVTVNPSDDIVRVQQTQESNGLTTLTLFHFDGTSTTYNHVTQQNLAQSATSTIPMTSIVTNTITNSAVTPVTSAVECQNCILQRVTDYVSLLQLMLGY
jgi:hypothetical protein